MNALERTCFLLLFAFVAGKWWRGRKEDVSYHCEYLLKINEFNELMSSLVPTPVPLRFLLKDLDVSWKREWIMAVPVPRFDFGSRLPVIACRSERFIFIVHVSTVILADKMIKSAASRVLSLFSNVFVVRHCVCCYGGLTPCERK